MNTAEQIAKQLAKDTGRKGRLEMVQVTRLAEQHAAGLITYSEALRELTPQVHYNYRGIVAAA